MQVKDKVVLITGASRGLGVEMARHFGRAGARLALAARSQTDLEQVRQSLQDEGVEAAVFPADVSDRAATQRLVADVTGRLGPIDILINNAGIEQVVEFERMDLDRLAQIIDVNVKGLITLTRLVVPQMIDRRSGQIVNIASMAGLVPVPHNTVYATSKHAVVGFSRSLRLELAEHGVGVSVVCPGFVDGGMFERWGRPAPSAAGAVSVVDVAKATLKAAQTNRGELKVNSALGKLGPVLQAVSPSFSAKMLERTGVAGFLRKQAEINSRESVILIEDEVPARFD